MASEFSFESTWSCAAPPEEVYAVLEAVEFYPQWWPQIRAMARTSDTAGFAVCRSLAPFSLRLFLDAETVDPVARDLKVRISGDLDGWCRFRLRPVGAGTQVEFTQQVHVVRRLLRLAATPLRPLLSANHAWMMRGCRRGLARRIGVNPGQTRPRR